MLFRQSVILAGALTIARAIDVDSICSGQPAVMIDSSTPDVKGTLETAAQDSLILVKDGTYSVASTITLAASGLTICGESRDGAIFTTTVTSEAPDVVFAVSGANIGIYRLTIAQGTPNTGSSAIDVKDSLQPNTRVQGFTLAGSRVIHSDTAVSIKGENWTVASNVLICHANCASYQVPSGGNAPYGTGVWTYGSVGSNTFSDNQIGSEVAGSAYAGVWVTKSGASAGEYLDGSLELRGNTEVEDASTTGPHFPLAFAGFDIGNFDRKDGTSVLSVVVESNILPASQGLLVFWAYKDLAGEAIHDIYMFGNTINNYDGKCAILIDQGVGQSFKAQSTDLLVYVPEPNKMYAPDESLADLSVINTAYAECPGSSDALMCYRKAGFLADATAAGLDVVVVLPDEEQEPNGVTGGITMMSSLVLIVLMSIVL